MNKWVVGGFCVLFTLLCLGASQGEEKPLKAGELYDSAMGLYYQGRYEAALGSFTQLIRSFPESQSVSFSVYMIGQCYLAMGRPDEAIQQFTLYLKKYPDGYRVKEAEKGIETARERVAQRKETPPERTVDTVRVSPDAQAGRRRICSQIVFLEAKNMEEVERKFKDLKKAGVDTVIVRVFQNRGDRAYRFAHPKHEEGVYFRTDHAPVVDDLLGPLAEMAHRNGLELFAWMTTRYADYGLDGQWDLRCQSYNFERKRMEIARGLSLFHPQTLKRLEGLFRDLGRYPIDGILFQDDLILKHNEDFSVEAGKAFLKEFGYAPHPDVLYLDPYRSDSGKYFVRGYTDQFWTWVSWKNRWLMDVARQCRVAAKASNPNLKFGLNLYYEAVLNQSNGLAWFSQSLSEALKQDFDYYAVMAYHRQAMRELHLEEKKAIHLMAEVAQKAVRAVGDPSKVMMKIQIMDWKAQEPIPARELDEVVTKILEQGKVSLAFVPYSDSFSSLPLKAKWNSAPQ